MFLLLLSASMLERSTCTTFESSKHCASDSSRFIKNTLAGNSKKYCHNAINAKLCVLAREMLSAVFGGTNVIEF